MKNLLLALSLVLVPACGGGPAPVTPGSSAEAHSTSGTITEIREEGRVIVVSHEEMPGYMRAMTMPFEVEAGARDGSLKKGDAIVFTFVDQSDGKRVITKLQRK